MPLFESFAGKALEEGKLELLTVFNVVKEQEREEFNRWSNEHYEMMVQESHIIKYGDLNKLDPVQHVPYIYKVGDNGPEPEGGRDVYFPACKSKSACVSLVSFLPPHTVLALLLTANLRHNPLLSLWLIDCMQGATLLQCSLMVL